MDLARNRPQRTSWLDDLFMGAGHRPDGKLTGETDIMTKPAARFWVMRSGCLIRRRGSFTVGLKV
jgi:hypothetical protein